MTDNTVRLELENRMGAVKASIDKHYAKAKAAEVIYADLTAQLDRMALTPEPPDRIPAVIFTRKMDAIVYTYAAVRHPLRSGGSRWSVTGRNSLTSVTWERVAQFAAAGQNDGPVFTYLAPAEFETFVLPAVYSDMVPPGAILVGNFAANAEGVPYHFPGGGVGGNSSQSGTNR